MTPLTELLLLADQILTKHKLLYWLDSGTLLGAIRNGELLPWEHDIDLSLWRSDVSEELEETIANEFEEKGYVILRTPHYTTIMGESIWLDLCYYTVKDNTAYIPVYVANSKSSLFLHHIREIAKYTEFYRKSEGVRGARTSLLHLMCSLLLAMPSIIRQRIMSASEYWLGKIGYNTWVVPVGYFKQFRQIELCGVKFNIPLMAEGYLAWRYGLTWRKPNKNWDNNNDGGLTRVWGKPEDVL